MLALQDHTAMRKAQSVMTKTRPMAKFGGSVLGSKTSIHYVQVPTATWPPAKVLSKGNSNIDFMEMPDWLLAQQGRHTTHAKALRDLQNAKETVAARQHAEKHGQEPACFKICQRLHKGWMLN